MSILSKISRKFELTLNESVEFDKFDTFELEEIRKWINQKKAEGLKTYLVEVPKEEYYLLVAASQDELETNIKNQLATDGVVVGNIFLDPLDYDHEIFTESVINEEWEIGGKNVLNNLDFYKVHRDFINQVVREGKIGTYQAYAIRPNKKEIDIIGTKGIITYNFDLEYVKFWDNSGADFEERVGNEFEQSENKDVVDDTRYADEDRFIIRK